MRRDDRGAVYLAVRGLEAALALAFGVLPLGERLSVARVIAAVLILASVGLLRPP